MQVNFFRHCKSRHSALWNALALFSLVSGLLIVVDGFSIRFGFPGSQRVADDLLGGVVSASIFYWYERQRQRRFREQLHMIDLVNHHIRNALQPLLLVSYGAEPKLQMNVIEDCVRRVDWVLREVLPGRSGVRFVAQNHEWSGRRPLEVPPWDAGWSSGSEDPWPATESDLPRFFSRWLENWRDQNEKAG